MKNAQQSRRNSLIDGMQVSPRKTIRGDNMSIHDVNARYAVGLFGTTYERTYRINSSSRCWRSS